MPKETRVRPQRELTRKQISRREKEQHRRQQLIIGTAMVLGLVVLVLAWGFYDQYVLRPGQPVATVYGVPIRLDTYQKMVRYWRWRYNNDLNYLNTQKQNIGADDTQAFLVQYIDQQMQSVQNELMQVDVSTLDNLIDEQLVLRECVSRTITVSADEVQLKMEEQFGYDRNPPAPEPITATLPITVTPTPTVAPMTQEQFNTAYSDWLKSVAQASNLSEAEFRKMVENSLYRTKLQDILKADVPTTGDQVHARHILLKTKEEAEAALVRLRNGEDFTKLAAELSQDTSNKDQGGDLGWFSRGDMVAEFDNVVFSLQPGQLSDVVETQFGAHIIRVDERDPNHPLDASALQRAQSAAIQDWFTRQRAAPEVVRKWDSTMVPKDLPTPSARSK